MSRQSAFAASFLAIALAVVACAEGPPHATPMKDGVPTYAPGGWMGFCDRNPGDPKCPR